MSWSMTQMIINHLHCSGWIISIVLLLFAAPLYAAACGNITAPDNWQSNFQSLGDISSTPITNCADPFGVTTDPQNPYALEIAGQSVAAGSHQTVMVTGDAVTDYGYTGRSHQSGVTWSIFRHVGEDLEYVLITPPEMTDTDYITFAETYFTDEAVRALYIEIYESDDPNSYFYEYNAELDENIAKTDAEGKNISSRFYNYLFAAELAHEQIRPALPLGTYTFVWVEYLLIETQRTWWEQVIDSMIPTAYAADFPPPNIYTQTITLTKAPPEPVGASSVLFLPGIQASRLYTDGVLGTEDELWIPNWNQDVRQLSMTASGESVSPIYTRDILDQVTGLGTVYQSFSQQMDSLVADGVIKDWEPYAYDWRYAVDTIVRDGTRYADEDKSLIELLENLASSSFSGKVTIIAHSNGGLLAKALLIELQRLHKEHLVDTLVLLASPQLGTPKAIGSLLHGLDQEAGGGIVIDASVARAVTKNMPGVYGLLPTRQYLDVVGKSFIHFAPQSSTEQFRNAYGDNIDNADELALFLLGVGDQRPEALTVYDAETLNSPLYTDARNLHEQTLQTWRAPSTTKVYEVVGVGLNTISGFEYKEFNERVCTTEFLSESCTTRAYYKPVIISSLYGDETVMAQSAKGYQGEKETYFVDLALIRQQNIRNRFRHVNFTEAPSIQEFVSRIIKDEPTTDIAFLSTTAVVPDIDFGVLSLNSPATVRISNPQEEIVEIVFSGDDFARKREEIPNSSIYYFGSTTYVVLPLDDSYTIDVTGTSVGGMTLAIDSVDNDTLETQYHIWVPDTQTGMKLSGELRQGVLSTLLVDANGDGVTDSVINPTTGIRELVSKSEISSTKTKQTSTKVSARKLPAGQVAGVSTSTPSSSQADYYQQLYVLLQQLSLLLKEYEKAI